MKNKHLAAWLLVMVLMAGAAVQPCKAEKLFAPEVTRQLDSTATNGSVDANRDFMQGVYRQEVVGALSVEAAARAHYLKEKYNVQTRPIGGSMITQFETDHAKSYNETMRKQLMVRFDRDIFKEADAYAADYAKGAADAKADFDKGVYQQELYGEPSSPRPQEQYLQQKYQVNPKTVGDDKVTNEVIGHAAGYNETMQKLLNEKFRKDIFKEAADSVGQSTGTQP